LPLSPSPFGDKRDESEYFQRRLRTKFGVRLCTLQTLQTLQCLQLAKNLINYFFSFPIFANICQDNIIIMATQFGQRIRELRTKQNMLLRQLASQLDVDTSIISKVERGDRQLKKEQIPLLAQILKADVEELQTLWLADQLYNMVQGEPMADEALKSVSKKIKKDK
jgi:HTH-type transcriptional regulator, competence development regulator